MQIVASGAALHAEDYAIMVNEQSIANASSALHPAEAHRKVVQHEAEGEGIKGYLELYKYL